MAFPCNIESYLRQDTQECPNCVSGRPFCGVGRSFSSIVIKITHFHSSTQHVTESYVMTIGGNVLENNANIVELTPLNSITSPVPPCLQSLAPLPENIQFAAGGLLSRNLIKL